ncbi:lipoprotein signal peptidase [Aquirufa ecclesiirivi]|uniref:lipoprotein signal peptidase n=1 Tax=Aquirufa ecclesiirivi TaxID=2715124 RepID=UPI00140A6F36|nr:lipoprotein signal peptidase [Aquirufa ecclesiirivi]NHC49838.1 lipoprotein signal peptidase [Aquirufa ecclesiirivi]
MKYYRYFLVSIAIILIDQAIKISVHYFMEPGYFGQIEILGSYFKLHYTLNPGMAFGIQLGTVYGKLMLTSFRIVAMFGIGYYLYSFTKKKMHAGLLVCMGLILGGAIGNLIDSVFYGVWFNNAPLNAPMTWFHGQVIDMFFFDIWEGILPNWVPIWGGSYYSTPIFNFADASIFCGVVLFLVFQNKFLEKHEAEKVDTTSNPESLNAPEEEENTLHI